MSKFSLVRHNSRSPDVAALLGILESRDVRYIVIGSIAAAVYGVELQAADLDIVPDTDKANLRRLVDALREMEAKPIGPFGDWTALESGEKKWLPRPTTEQELTEWMPDVEDLWTLDHMYVTRFGNFDVVPEIGGRTTPCGAEPACDLVRGSMCGWRTSTRYLPAGRSPGGRTTCRGLRHFARSSGDWGQERRDQGAPSGMARAYTQVVCLRRSGVPRGAAPGGGVGPALSLPKGCPPNR